MARKTAEGILVHPQTGQAMRIQAIEDGTFRLVFPPRDDRPRRWAMANNFTGGNTGTRMQIVEVDRAFEPDDIQVPELGLHSDRSVCVRPGTGCDTRGCPSG